MWAKNTLNEDKRNVRMQTGINRRYYYGHQEEKQQVIEKADMEAEKYYQKMVKQHEKEFAQKKRELDKQQAQLEKKRLRNSKSDLNQQSNEPRLFGFGGLFRRTEHKVSACGPMPEAANKYSMLVK